MENSTIKHHLILILLPAILFVYCLRQEDLKLPFDTYTPKELSDGWDISTPAEQQINEAGLCDIYRYIHDSEELWQIRSLLIFKNNRLIAESYTKDRRDMTNPKPVWSCTKQVMGILAGIAIDKGYIRSVESRISEYLPQITDRFEDKSDITIGDLLTMRSGIDFQNDGINGQSAALLKQIPPNSLDFILELALSYPHGTTFNYNDGDPQIISAILQQQTAKTTKQWADELLFSRLNIKNWDWAIYKDDITMGAFGIMFTPRDLAKIGQLVLNNGYWGDEQIVSQKWITEMTSIKVQGAQTDIDKPFGYYWWIDPDRNLVFMYGHGGQYVFVDRGTSLMVVMTAEPNTQGRFALSLTTALDIYDRIASLMSDRLTLSDYDGKASNK